MMNNIKAFFMCRCKYDLGKGELYRTIQIILIVQLSFMKSKDSRLIMTAFIVLVLVIRLQGYVKEHWH